MTTENQINRNILVEGKEQERGLQLADLWAMVWYNRGWYILSVALCLLVAAFYIYRTPKTYLREAKVIMDDTAENSTMRDLAAFSNNITRFRGSGGTNVYNEMEAFGSPDLMEKVIKRLGYETTYIEHQFMRKRELFTTSPFTLTLDGGNPLSFFAFDVVKDGDDSFWLKNFMAGGERIRAEKIRGRLNETIMTPVGALMLKPGPNIDKWKYGMRLIWANPMLRAKSYIKHFSTSLAGKESSVVVLSLSDQFPLRAQNILSTIIDIYNEEWVDNKNKAAVNTTEFINERLDVIEKELGSVEGNLKEYKEKNKITDIEAVSQAYLKQSSEYGEKAFEVNTQLSIAKFIKEYISDPNKAEDLIPANSGLTSVSVENQIKAYNDCLLNRNRLFAESSSENPAVAELNETLVQLRMAVNRSIESLIATLQLQVDKIEKQENDVIRRIASTSGQQLQLLSIERQQKVKEQLYIYLLQKREENEIAALVNVGNTRLIMKPNGSPYPASPSKRLIVLLGLIIGLGIPFAVFFLMNQWDTRVKTRDDISGLDVPFLAEIPQMGLKGKWIQRWKVNRFNDSNCRIVVKAGKRNMINEAFRVLRTNLDLMTGASKEGCNRIMLTSFNPNAGKTFVIMNMASTMALKGARTLLLDLDMRKATLSKALGKNKTGVSAYLSGQCDNLKELIYEVGERLFLMPVGVLPPNPAELLVSERFNEMIEALSKEFDYIFMDCPPVDIVADTGIIARAAEITVFVIRSGVFDKRALTDVQALHDSGRYNRMTVILNGVESQRRAYGNYGYGYGYGNSEEDDEA